MKQELAQNDIYAITALTIDNNPNEVVAIIRKHGVMLPSNPNTKQIETAFGTLLTKSDAFRKDFATLASKSVATDSHVGADGLDLPPSKGIGTSSNLTLQNIPTTTITSTSKPSTSTKKSFKDSAFGSFLSSVFTPETIQSGINTGLNVWSIKQTGQPASNVGGDIGTGRDQLTENQQQTRGTSTTTMVLIGVGALALIGVAVYFYKKK